MFNRIELTVIDGDGWQFHCILHQDVGLLDTDGSSEILAGLRETVLQCLQLLLGVRCHCCILLTSIRGFPFVFVRWYFFG